MSTKEVKPIGTVQTSESGEFNLYTITDLDQLKLNLPEIWKVSQDRGFKLTAFWVISDKDNLVVYDKGYELSYPDDTVCIKSTHDDVVDFLNKYKLIVH